MPEEVISAYEYCVYDFLQYESFHSLTWLLGCLFLNSYQITSERAKNILFSIKEKSGQNVLKIYLNAEKKTNKLDVWI